MLQRICEEYLIPNTHWSRLAFVHTHQHGAIQGGLKPSFAFASCHLERAKQQFCVVFCNCFCSQSVNMSIAHGCVCHHHSPAVTSTWPFIPQRASDSRLTEDPFWFASFMHSLVDNLLAFSLLHNLLVFSSQVQKLLVFFINSHY